MVWTTVKRKRFAELNFWGHFCYKHRIVKLCRQKNRGEKTQRKGLLEGQTTDSRVLSFLAVLLKKGELVASLGSSD